MTAEHPPITCIEDLRSRYHRRVPRMFRDYAESGSWTESTLRDNRAALSRLRLNQRVAIDLSERSVATELLGQPAAMPLALAPIGMLGMQHADGEIHAARAAEAAGVPFCLSTMSVCSIEDVAEHTTAPFWFQLYVMRDRGFVRSLMDRARAAGCSALVITLDLQILGQRHRDIKNGLSTPPRLSLRNLVDMALHPRWSLGMLGTQRRQFGNIVGHVDNVSDLGSLSAWTAQQFDPALSWDDVAWISEYWGGPVILKGLLDPRDAVQALATEPAAIIVSNHGGRQLDGAPAAADVLPGIVAAVRQAAAQRSGGAGPEVWVDGGIRSGQDLLKLLALGADAALVGRAFVYGLGANGQAGVERALAIIANELDLSMAFCGRTRIEQIDSDILFNGPAGR